MPRGLVLASKKWLDSLSSKKLQKHAEANNGQHTRTLRAKLKRSNVILKKDPDTGKWYMYQK